MLNLGFWFWLVFGLWYSSIALAIVTFTAYVTVKQELKEGCFSIAFILGMSVFWPISLPLWIVLSVFLKLLS